MNISWKNKYYKFNYPDGKIGHFEALSENTANFYKDGILFASYKQYSVYPTDIEITEDEFSKQTIIKKK